ncbi:GntR family transcriptional regulator [Acidihalobacter prosperus]|uniref:GntR family transcriptional regulator n=1 Tax=Acidihalobacter prosperus TaxID=160660 RepID=A0A1A6C0C8_9GAMM|nr:GntR family transcriptional regulator [Acidihalobacter prosperus]OBS08009.1 GntR family transcriptional regulator [Acidihalobacter prosperus]
MGRPVDVSAKPRAGTRCSAQDIYVRLREMILSFELYPGSRVTETELAEYFGVSRTPVREALQRLEQDAYLLIRPKQGCFIRQLDIAELGQYYEVRQDLEALSLRFACEHMADEALQALGAEWDPVTQPGRTDDPGVMVAREESFHLALAEGGGNVVLANYLRDINNHIRVVRRLDFTSGERIDRTYAEHHELVQCLLRRDLPGALALMQTHISQSEAFAKSLTLHQLSQRRNSRFGQI